MTAVATATVTTSPEQPVIGAGWVKVTPDNLEGLAFYLVYTIRRRPLTWKVRDDAGRVDHEATVTIEHVRRHSRSITLSDGRSKGVRFELTLSVGDQVNSDGPDQFSVRCQSSTATHHFRRAK